MKNQTSLQAVIGGVGGQGIIFLTRVLAFHARSLDLPVLVSEVHGMSQRGGSVQSHLKAGAFVSPLVRAGQADMVIALQAGEAIRNVGYLAPGNNGRPGGALIVNAPDWSFLSPEAIDALDQANISRILFDADAVAMERKAPLSANLVLLGYAAAKGGLPFDPASLLATVENISPPRFADQNRTLFNLGVEAGKA